MAGAAALVKGAEALADDLAGVDDGDKAVRVVLHFSSLPQSGGYGQFFF